MTSLAQITVPFHGTELFIIEHNGQPYTPMKPIVDGMGLDWKSQFVKLKQRFAQGMVEITIPTKGGLQEMVCFPVRKLFGWLMTISPNKIPNPETRAKVIMYQNECDDVLWDYWTKGQAINTRFTISPAQQCALQAIVHKRAGTDRRAIAEMWSRHNRHFNIAKYSQLLAVHFDDAYQYLNNMDLKTKIQPQPQPHVQTAPVIDQELLRRFVVNMHFLRSWWAHYHAGIKGINPHAAASVHEHFISGSVDATTIARHIGIQIPHNYINYYPWNADNYERQRYWEIHGKSND